jgi:hypothetical protein
MSLLYLLYGAGSRGMRATSWESSFNPQTKIKVATVKDDTRIRTATQRALIVIRCSIRD